jgi:SPP1 gp7 family putative phage head morphogenesis protein
MNETIIYSISEYLTKAVNSSYKKAKKDVVKNIKKYIVTGKTFNDKLPSYLSTDYSATDKKFLANFEKECFTVACVGTYDLEEKMKEVAKGILELPETDTRDRFKLFVKESQNLLSQYIPDGDKIPPAGWLKTNLQNAVNSSYNASQWQKLQDPAVKELYPAYKYKTREDSHVRNEHAVLNNSVYLADDPIWKVIYPPNGWNCRCYINYLSTDDTKEPGNNVIYPSDQERKDTVKKGRISQDFARNSGMEGHIFDKWISAKLKDIPENVLKEIKGLVKEHMSVLRAPDYGIEIENKIVPIDTTLSKYVEGLDINEKLLSVAEKNISTLKFTTNGKGSFYEEKTGLLTLDASWHINKLFKKFDITHELSHIYHLKNNIVTGNFVDIEVIKLYNECKTIFETSYKSDLVLRDKYLEYRDFVKKEYDMSLGDYKLLTSNTGDVIASLTKGEYGRGHEIEYWEEGNNKYAEFFVGASVNKLLGNVFLEKQFPLLFKKLSEIKKYYE